jgi:malate permease and related proteins
MYGQFFVLFALVFSGYFLRKVQVINEGMAGGLHSFISYFAFPCLLVYKIGTLDMTSGLATQLLVITLLSCALFVLYAVCARLFVKGLKYPHRVAAVAELSMAAPNNGFMGFPIALLFFGQEGLFLIMGHNIALNLYAFTYGLYVLRKTPAKPGEAKDHRSKGERFRQTSKKAWKVTVRLVLNPNILAMVAGFIICFGHISLNNPVGTYLEYMANIATPMAMMFIGATLAGTNFLDLFRNRIVWESAIAKLILIPAVSLLAVIFLPIDPVMKGILVIATALPTAAIISVLVQQEGKDALMASRIIFFTTVMSMGTIPLWMQILHWVLPI